jgi:hypothetical protein
MSENIIKLHPGDDRIDRDIVLLCEELLERARNGALVGLALIEHLRGDEVAISVSMTSSYHQINSGAARLAWMLASQKQITDA